jgi:HEAT repeat protein
MAPVPEIADEEIEEARQRDPIVAGHLEHARDHTRAARRAYFEAFAAMRPDLSAAGYQVESVGALLAEYARTEIPYKTAVPVLVKWLPVVDYVSLRHDIVRTLSVPWAKPEASQPLIVQFGSGPEELRWAVGNALEQINDPAIVHQLQELITNRDYGNARDPLIRAVGKAKARDAVLVLIGLLDDPVAVYSAINVLGKLKATAAREKLNALRAHPDPQIRKDVEKALKRIA